MDERGAKTRLAIRIGIDVGGTFTDVVAVDARTRALLAAVKIPTTHDAAEGVAAGITAGIRELFARHTVDPDAVRFIAHSTTQATNALLEGDLAPVGVLGLLEGSAVIARRQMRFPRFDLAPGIPFQAQFAFARADSESDIRAAIERLAAGGAQTIAVSQAFGVDRPQAEERARDAARALGLEATAGHEVSALYGLRARTRTAALNAAMLPKMVRTANMTDRAVQAASIAAPLMVMRSDGGVMNLEAMRSRPILTMLSGPAAGIAGALMHERITDGIFVEVGGTSSDCSAIRFGVPQMRPARVGGHRTMLRTLDVRTIGVAGGSMIRLSAHGIAQVGPRSAHIAGLPYAAFSDPRLFEGARVERIAPTPRDRAEYAAIVARDGTRVALTPTCAANALGRIPRGNFAHAAPHAAKAAFALLGTLLGSDPEALAREVLEHAGAALAATIEELIADYEMEAGALTIVGGGGGAAAIVPAAADRVRLPHRLAKDAQVIAPIGVALALVREVVERTVADPTPEQIASIRREAQDAAAAAGAAPALIEVAVEVDPQRNLVRAAACGAHAMMESAAPRRLSDPELLGAAALVFRAPENELAVRARTPAFTVFERSLRVRGSLGRVTQVAELRVVDAFGVGKLALRRAAAVQTTGARALDDLRAALEERTQFGDVGRALPQSYLLHGARIADFSGLANLAQALALAQEELAGLDPGAPVVILAAARTA